jgi:hypothetical protein
LEFVRRKVTGKIIAESEANTISLLPNDDGTAVVIAVGSQFGVAPQILTAADDDGLGATPGAGSASYAAAESNTTTIWPIRHVPISHGRRVENLVPENLGLD